MAGCGHLQLMRSMVGNNGMRSVIFVNVLKKTLLPNETLQAVEVFAQELNCGYSFADAARNFFMTVGKNENPN